MVVLAPVLVQNTQITDYDFHLPKYLASPGAHQIEKGGRHLKISGAEAGADSVLQPTPGLLKQMGCIWFLPRWWCFS